MSSSEEQAILARISKLAGQINRHKNAQGDAAPAPAQSSRYHPYQSGPSQPAWGRGAANHYHHPRGGYRVGKPAPHRHRSLVLNGNNGANGGSNPESGANSDASSNSSWVTKKDRHLQLINQGVYEKETQARAKAIAETERQKRQILDARERAKLMGHLHRVSAGAGAPPAPTNSSQLPAQYEVVIDGIRFHVVKNGSKLVKFDDNNAPKATPKTAVIGGVKFYRSRNGNLYRHGVVKAQRRSGAAVTKVNAPCRIFSTTGSCANGPRCRYTHDPTKVAICKNFLLKGECVNGDACDLSHELTPERTPSCLHFAKGKCKNPNCHYTHAQVTHAPDSLVCRPFGIYGYCSKGDNCEERHVFECPDFSNTGVCKTKGCKLPHRERASVLRKTAAASASSDADDAEMEDVSSDEDGESVDSNDVDSDAVDEFLGQNDESLDDAFDAQREFIQF